MLTGKAHKFGDDITTDHIAPGRLAHLRSNLAELAKHCLEDADPNFSTNVHAGDFVVGGKNFGLGSSREHAPLIIKMNGVSAVLAKSFARIFYRNAVNLGLPVLVCDTDLINNGDVLEADLANGYIDNKTTGVRLTFVPLPGVMLTLLNEGGLNPYIKKYGDFKF